ncbi:sensor histidine kinase [Variovorax sp. GT1P44]|uniref:sensor histidine kinase n=1 Tax=Variovorax sp. GT1P44 TaxID=3443742 RepID=UPI003F470A3D
MRRLLAVVAAVSMAVWVAPASALDPSREVSKYGHTVWRNLDGFGPGTIGPIAQTADGYLWLGTPSGLLRFDGVRAVRWSAPSDSALPDERVRALFGSRDGALWIGTARGLASWKDGKLTLHPSTSGKTVNAIEEDEDGTIWVGGAGGTKAFVCTIGDDNSECLGENEGFGNAILALYRDASGALWAAGTDRIWKLKPKPIASVALTSQIGALRTVTGTPDGGVVVGTRGQILEISDGAVRPTELPAWAQGRVFTKALRDRDGALWIAAADFGLLHFRTDGVDSFTSLEGLSGDHVLGLFEDREGDIWVSTSRGLDRFRPMAGAAYTRVDGVAGRAASVLAARDGSVWVSTSTGVYRFDKGRVASMRDSRSATLFEDRSGRIWMGSQYDFGYMDAGQFVAAPGVPGGTIDGIAEDSKGAMWIAHRSSGLLRLLPDGSVERTPWADLQKRGRVSTMVIDPLDDSLWLGLWSGDVVNVHEGEVRSFVSLREPDSRGVIQIRIDADGALWIGSRAGLTRIKRGRVTRLGRDSGIPCDGAHWTLFDERTVSMYTPCGLVQLDRSELDAWSAAADQGTSMKVKVRLLDHWDGVGQPSNASAVGQIEATQLFTPKAASSRDGRLWVVTGDGIVSIDPLRIPTNENPPPVHVEQITSDSIAYEARDGLSLPPLQRNLEIQYTGLSLAVPERVQFRYKLEGRDVDWQEAGNRREAFYTDLSPGRYRFRVMAANSSGVWNTEGDTLNFSIAPAYYQTLWFYALCALGGLAVLVALHRLRLSRVSGQIRGRLEARLAERERIARELHDTLLQGIQGLILRFQAAADRIPPDVPARALMEKSLDRADKLLTESRDKVKDLRPSASVARTLEEALVIEGAQFAELHPASFVISVQGALRSLHPIVQEEILLVAREALGNAFRHARAANIEAEVTYGEEALQIRVRDDGQGVDSELLASGRPGHFGLTGMRERAHKLGAHLVVWSKPGAGTEVELRVPAAVAYPREDRGPTRLPRWVAALRANLLRR